MNVDAAKAEGQVPGRWLDQPPLTFAQKRLFRQYPDARSCLPSEEQMKEVLNLGSFDWSSIQNDDHALVCVYRIAERLQTPKAMAEWLIEEKFKSSGPRKGVFNKAITTVFGTLMLEGRWPLYPGWFSLSRYMNKIFAYSYTVQVNWYADGRVGSVQISYTHE